MTTYVTPALSFHGIHIPVYEFSAARIDLVLMYGRAAFLVFSFLLAALAFQRLRRSTLRESAQNTAVATALLQKLSGIETDLTRIEAALVATDAHVTALATRIEENARTAGAGGQAGYGIAIRMARGGATREELVAVTGLTQQEADLIIRLHARVAHGQGIAA